MLKQIREIGKLAPLPSKPQVPDAKMILAQARLVFEETMELLEAVGVKVFVANAGEVDRHDIELEFDPKRKINIVEVAKEAADVSVVTIGMLSEFGIADTPVLEEVDANNLGKFDPASGGYLDENRKWRKPANYPKPDILGVLVAQGYQPEVSHEERTEESQDLSVPNRGDGQEGTTQEALS
jgi:predicted HAD superfamily Cof-like phosphohydrolase